MKLLIALEICRPTLIWRAWIDRQKQQTLFRCAFHMGFFSKHNSLKIRGFIAPNTLYHCGEMFCCHIQTKKVYAYGKFTKLVLHSNACCLLVASVFTYRKNHHWKAFNNDEELFRLSGVHSAQEGTRSGNRFFCGYFHEKKVERES